jgi:hypothetical protein
MAREAQSSEIDDARAREIAREVAKLARGNSQIWGIFVTTRRQSLSAAITRLREMLAAPENDVGRDAAIQRFEFCFELAWKAIQERAREEGMDCQSPKNCLKLAFNNSSIIDEPAWLAGVPR